MLESSVSKFVKRVTVGLFTNRKYDFQFQQATKELIPPARHLQQSAKQLRSRILMKRILRLGALPLLHSSARYSTVAYAAAAATNHKFRAASYNNPHPDKRKTGGEDAFFFDETTLVVADGVGGWANWGVNSGDYSRALCNHIKKIAEDFSDDADATPRKILVSAALRTTVVGSSTCCLAMIDKNSQTLKVANIGDSGYLIARPNEEGSVDLVHASTEQLHSFNFPYQIGTEGDAPTKAQEFEHELQDGDIIVLGTDGLFDNLDDEAIIEVLSDHISQNRLQDSDEAAHAIGERATTASQDKTHLSPFAKKARKARYAYLGGKPDDITLIVAVADFAPTMVDAEE